MGEAIDYEYRRILVIGGRKTGKTSLLSTAVGGDFSANHRPTARCQTFYDMEHMLELIDTPGLDDLLLNGTKDTPPPDFDGVRDHYHKFRDDEVVQEMISLPKDGKPNLLIDVDISTVDAYLIVYTDDPRSKRLAKALRLAILSKPIADARRAIFLLYHQGDFDTPPFASRVHVSGNDSADGEPNDGFIELVFLDSLDIQTKAYHHRAVRFLPKCSAQTGEGVHRTLAILRQELDKMATGATGGKEVSKTKKNKVPADLFAFTTGGDAAGVMAARLPGGGGPNAMTGAGADPKTPKARAGGKRGLIAGGAGGHTSSASATAGEEEVEDEIPSLPAKKGQQRAQCSSMAAAACTLQ